MKIVKKLLYVLILVIIVAGLALIALSVLINPNKLKPIIAQQIATQTGYQVIIDDKLSWSFYPRLGVKVQHMTFNTPGLPIFADLQDVLIATDLIQLFKGQQPLEGSVYIASIKLMNLQLSKAHAKLIWHNGVLTLKPLTASLYEGTLQGEAHGNQLTTMPHWDWNVEFNDVQLKPLLQDLNKGNTKLNLVGIGRINMQAVTQGKSKEQLLNYLNGTLQFSLNRGTVEGMDLNYLVQSAEAIINKQPISIPDHLNETRFDSLTGSAVIKNGIANTDNLLLVSDTFSTKGEGQINLLTQVLDYHLQVTLLQPNKTQLVLPVSINGDLQNPAVKLDTSVFGAVIDKEKLSKVRMKVEEEIKQLPEEANKFLKKLMGE